MVYLYHILQICTKVSVQQSLVLLWTSSTRTRSTIVDLILLVLDLAQMSRTQLYGYRVLGFPRSLKDLP